MNVVIALVAKPGRGKGTFPKLLQDACAEDKYYPSIGGPRFSDSLRETLQWYGVLESTENLQDLGKWLNSKKPGAVTCGMSKKLEQDMHEVKIADGVRWLYDERMIRDLGGILVYITATPEIAWERAKKRNEKAGDAEKTFEQFLKEDNAENEIYVDEIGSRRDFKIDNNGTLEDYQRQVKEFYQKFLKPLKPQNKENPS